MEKVGYVEGGYPCHIRKGWMCNYLEGKQANPEWITKVQFTEKEKIVQANILLASEDKILCNMRTAKTTAIELQDRLNTV